MKVGPNDRLPQVLDFLRAEIGPKRLATLSRRVGAPADGDRFPTLSTMQEAALLREACRDSDDPTLAARAGLAVRDGRSLTAYIARSSPSLRAAIIGGGRFYALADATTSFSIRRVGDRECVEVASSDGALLRHHRFQEFLVFGLLSRLRALSEVEFLPEALNFRHVTTPQARELERLAGCPIAFGAETNAIVMRAGALDRPLPGYDPVLMEYLSRTAAAELADRGLDATTVRARVERIILKSLPGQMVGIDVVSKDLGVSRRTLGRKLGEEGTSYRALVEQLRYDVACTYLKDGLSISQIAFYLGYADQASFATAFKRWSGQSPSSYRSGHGQHG